MSNIDADHTNKEDVYQAQTCVGWLHWVVAEYSLAVGRLPKGLGERNAAIGGVNSVSEWTSVCVLKAAYIRANCLARDGKRVEALASYNAALPSLDRLWSGQPIHKQLRYWSELFLTEYCALSSESSRQNDLPPGDRESIASYRCWARYWEAMGHSVAGGVGFKGSSNSVPRRTIWRDYYSTLSQVLQNDLEFAPGNLGKASHETPARTQLATELKRVESAYERLLLDETEFPRADEHREEVEAFVLQVMKNWQILCGRGWSEKDIGTGGRAAISRSVLSTLYNAATKTYHSTAILRSLFDVHVSLAEFDLAFKAFDSYLDIVKKVKARVEKTGVMEPSLDEDGAILETISHAIMALCLYGHQSAIEKARQLGAELEDWLSKLPQTKATENGTSDTDTNAVKEPSKSVAPQTLSLAWQAIGLSHAYWSRVTPDASSRTEIQAKAVRSLRRSLASEFGRSKDVRSIFAVALLLAERKELSPAIDLVRSALMVPKDQQAERRHVYGAYWQERSLVPVWHLLALLLSARQDYAMAVRACDGALEQFKDSTVLFGKQEESFRSDASGESAAKELYDTGLVDEMDDAEKESILEVKMTQLTLIELQDGPNAAVNSSYELLALFTRLFGTIAAQSTSKAGSTLEPPKTSATTRGFRGSIFGGKSDRSQPPTRQSSVATVSEQKSTLPSRPATTATSSPVIQVTEDARRPVTRRDSSARSESGRRNSLKKRNRSASRDRAGSAGSTSQRADGDSFFTPTPDGSQGELSPTKGPSSRATGFGREKTVSSLKSILSSNSKSTQQSELVVESAYATPHMLPLVQFPKGAEKIRHVTILIKVWTMIAGFYRRAEMLDECKAAVSEAQKLVQSLEADASRDSSASSSLNGAAWGESKTIDALWGDVYSEVSSNTPLCMTLSNISCSSDTCPLLETSLTKLVLTLSPPLLITLTIRWQRLGFLIFCSMFITRRSCPQLPSPHCQLVVKMSRTNTCKHSH